MANGKLTPDREIDAEPERDVFLFSSSTEILEPRTVSAMDRHMGLFHMPAFRAVAAEAGGPSDATCTTGAAVLDANGDGRPDIYVLEESPGSNRLFINTHMNTGSPVETDVGFTEETGGDIRAPTPSESQGKSMEAVAFDANGNGKMDLFVVNEVYYQLLTNDGDGHFETAFTSDDYTSLAQQKHVLRGALAFDVDNGKWANRSDPIPYVCVCALNRAALSHTLLMPDSCALL